MLRSPFTSLVEVGKFHYPFLPVGWILSDRFPSMDKISGVHSPLLVVAGRKDSIVPFDQSRALFDAADSRVKRFVAVDGAGHNDPELVSGSRMLDRVLEFLSEAGTLASPADGSASSAGDS